jgi:5,10-methylene-tetrahydrofolate dehydrogenase/methenyl tetrahydrofolate cyclohydrolase
MSFSVMSIAALADIVTGIMGQELVISDTVFNSFVVITLGAFGIAEAGKIFGDKKQEKASKAKKSYDYEEEELG